jgi:restriction system protein
MLPLLEYASDGKEHVASEPLGYLANRLGLSDEERQARLPSGGYVISDRMHWSLSYLRQAQLIENVRRGCFIITERGRSVLASNPARIDNDYLRQFPEFEQFMLRHRKGLGRSTPSLSATTQDEASESLEEALRQPATPKETLESSYAALEHELASELLTRIKGCSPHFFEQLVVDLLVKMGYGGSRQDAGAAIGRSGDEGIDGIIKEDRLGLDAIYIQAKRWERAVGRPEVQQFAGALHGQRARKGIFITTSQFTREAVEYVKAIDTKIVLIDGDHLTNYMIEHDVGVSVVSTYQLKKVDLDYFDEE